MQKVRAEIHLQNIRKNAQAFKTLGKNKLCAVVKANAYGHGAEEIVFALDGIADCFAVAIIEEGLAIRTAACGKEILVFTPPTDEEEGYMLAANGFIASVCGLDNARLLSDVCKKYRLPLQVHLKVNTGMNRYGMDIAETEKTCAFLSRDPYLKVTGIYSHLYGTTVACAERQRRLFLKMQGVCLQYFPEAISHLSATYGALLGQKFAFDMLRIGIGLYGYLPTGAKGVFAQEQNLNLGKGMTVYAKRVATRRYELGGAGYGEYFDPKNVKNFDSLSTYRFGYADGFLRRRDNGVFGCENNANNLCMDACIRYGEGKTGVFVPVLTDADETAKRTGTISYEVLCAATRRAEFVYDNE